MKSLALFSKGGVVYILGTGDGEIKEEINIRDLFLRTHANDGKSEFLDAG